MKTINICHQKDFFWGGGVEIKLYTETNECVNVFYERGSHSFLSVRHAVNVEAQSRAGANPVPPQLTTAL